MQFKEEIIDMRKVYCEVKTGRCTEAGHRTSLVINEFGHLVGIIDFPTVLRALIPGFFERFTEDHAAHGQVGFKERVLMNAEVEVGDIMLKSRGSIKVGDNLLEAVKVMLKSKVTVLPVYEGGTLVGVLRDSDLFLATASILTD